MSCPNCGSANGERLGAYLGKAAIFQRMYLVRCTACGLVHAQPTPTAAELEGYYSRYWDGTAAVSTPSTRRYYLAQAVSRLRYLLPYLPRGRFSLLDVGAGLGLLERALRLCGVDASYSAVEMDRAQLEGLRQRFGPRHAFAGLADLPPERHFDVAVLAHVLEHMAEPHALLERCFARLRPGGLLFVEVPNGDHRYKNLFESHLLFFDETSLRDTLARHGPVLDVSTVGRLVAGLWITEVHPRRDPLRPLKELVKSALAFITPDVIEQHIQRFCMSDYGGDRQWLRALAQRPPA